MPKYPYKVQVTNEVDHGDGTTTFTYSVSNGNGVVTDANLAVTCDDSTMEQALQTMKHAVRNAMIRDAVRADIPTLTSFTFNPTDVI